MTNSGNVSLTYFAREFLKDNHLQVILWVLALMAFVEGQMYAGLALFILGVEGLTNSHEE